MQDQCYWWIKKTPNINKQANISKHLSISNSQKFQYLSKRNMCTPPTAYMEYKHLPLYGKASLEDLVAPALPSFQHPKLPAQQLAVGSIQWEGFSGWSLQWLWSQQDELWPVKTRFWPLLFALHYQSLLLQIFILLLHFFSNWLLFSKLAL